MPRMVRAAIILIVALLPATAHAAKHVGVRCGSGGSHTGTVVYLKSPDGSRRLCVLTCAHGIVDEQSVPVVFPTKQPSLSQSAAVLAIDADRDLALLEYPLIWGKA